MTTEDEKPVCDVCGNEHDPEGIGTQVEVCRNCLDAEKYHIASCHAAIDRALNETESEGPRDAFENLRAFKEAHRWTTGVGDHAPPPDRHRCVQPETADGIDFRMHVDPALPPEARAALAAVAKAAYDQLRPMVHKATDAVLAFERAVHAAAQAEIAASAPEQVEHEARKADEARNVLLEMVAKPIMVHSRDAAADAAAEIAYLKETCLRQQHVADDLRRRESAASARAAELEKSSRALRLEAEEISRVLAKAQEAGVPPEWEWRTFEENTAVRCERTNVSVPVARGDSVLVVAKSLAAALHRASTRGGA